MEKRKVSVEQYVEEVLEGRFYKGYVKIANTKLEYKLVFGIPIEKFEKIEPPTERNEARDLFRLTMKYDDAIIELTSEEYSFFLPMIVNLVLKLYSRNSSDTILVSLKSSASYNFPADVCEMLSLPKFGCAVVAV